MWAGTGTVKDLLFDCDSVRYAAGFACQKTVYLLPDDSREYTKLRDAKEVIADNDLPEDTVITPKVYEEELSHCLQVLKHMIQKALDEVPHNRHSILLTKGENFRHELASIQPYKAGRAPKPFWHKEMFEYQQDVWNGIMIPNLEADDMIGLLHNESTVCCGIDKDLLTVPGLHYNYKKQEYLEVTPEMADRYFYTQMLEGDSSDNIQGLPYCAPSTIERFSLHHSAAKGCGSGSAHKILDGAEHEDLFRVVQACWYEQRLHANPDMGESVLAQDADVDLLETGRLLHMTRELHADGSPRLWEFPI
jgi:5'-3' exonuclease